MENVGEPSAWLKNKLFDLKSAKNTKANLKVYLWFLKTLFSIFNSKVLYRNVRFTY